MKTAKIRARMRVLIWLSPHVPAPVTFWLYMGLVAFPDWLCWQVITLLDPSPWRRSDWFD